MLVTPSSAAALSVAAALALAVATPAAALQITNADGEARVVEVYEGADGANVTQVTIAAGETRGSLCPNGCSLLTDESALSLLKSDDAVTIRDGRLERQR